MQPEEIINGIRRYTGSQFDAHLDEIAMAQGFIYDVLGWILGLVAIIIVAGGGFITILDLCYINFPIWQSKVRERQWDGGLSAKKLRLVSNDARLSVAEISDSNVNFRYLRRRIKSYIICAVILYICIGRPEDIVYMLYRIIVR